MIRHVKQPTPTSCAQACIAMITGADVHELIAKMRPGPKTGTRGAAIVRALRDNGVRCGDRFMGVRGRPLPNFAIVRIVYDDDRGHVVVKHGREWFDPLLEAPFSGDPTSASALIEERKAALEWVPGARITSALWIGDGMP